MRLLWLPDVLADADVPFRVIHGWQNSGRDLSMVRGVVWHDTVTPDTWGNRRVDELLRDGRPGVPGPLAQLGVDFNARVVIVAAGRANHNGYGRWGNNSLGIEVYAAGGLAGRERPWTAGQADTVIRATAAIQRHLGHTMQHGEGHREQDPDRKIDPYDINLSRLRIRVGELLVTPKGWDEMATKDEIKAALREVMTEDDYLVQHGSRQYLVREREGLAVWVKSPADFDRLLKAYPHRGEVESFAGLEVIA